ncbi:hypothetical protein ZOSMA_76G00200 [Zostera marina]|uniref:Uncharacterized protein n=1 Tax=Zostera marina TaxID=29655 RepID=A0A0K9NNV7_ZOSMR|nr:hypothetical protein ZOSMA_76G00200 [Zostera marina]
MSAVPSHYAVLASPFSARHSIKISRCKNLPIQSSLDKRWCCTTPYPLSTKSSNIKRTSFVCAATNEEAEKLFFKTVEVDRLIDMLMESNAKQLEKLVLENILAFNEGFWIRLAARSDTCKTSDDKKDYEDLAASVMNIIDFFVKKTKDKIESSTEILEAILNPMVEESGDIIWPPRDQESLVMMVKEVQLREEAGQLDEGFLAEINAQLRQASEDGDKPGLEAMLQKVLQVYASKVLSKRSYALKGSEVLKAEKLLESIIKAPEEVWNKLLIDGLAIGNGEISAEELCGAIKKRIERTLIRTESGSYQQRILTEFLRGIRSRSEVVVKTLKGS